MAFKRRKEEEHKPELIPLIDIIFLLLVFFLVTTGLIGAFEIIEGSLSIKIQKIEDSSGEEITEANILIQFIYDNGDIKYYLIHKALNPDDRFATGSYSDWINDNKWPASPDRINDLHGSNEIINELNQLEQPLKLAQVEMRLRQLRNIMGRKKKEAKILIRGEEEMPYYPILELIDFCKRENIGVVSLAVGGLDNLYEKIIY